MSTVGPCLLPTISPINSIGASSRSPSPITMVPSMGSLLNSRRMASTAAWSAARSLPRPARRAAETAARSVTRTISRESTRSKARCGRIVIDGAGPSLLICSSLVCMRVEGSAGLEAGRGFHHRAPPLCPSQCCGELYQFFSIRMTWGVPEMTRSRPTAASDLRTASSVVA